MAQHRKILEHEGGYSIQEKALSYDTGFDAKKVILSAENRLKWYES